MYGSCLCGAVRFEVFGTPEGVACCHCGQCRKQSGHVWASARAEDDKLTVTGEVSWFRSSEKVRRGFCPTCGSFLFWKHGDERHTSFALGAIDGATGLRLERHIFTSGKGDYYDIADGVPQR